MEVFPLPSGLPHQGITRVVIYQRKCSVFEGRLSFRLSLLQGKNTAISISNFLHSKTTTLPLKVVVFVELVT